MPEGSGTVDLLVINIGQIATPRGSQPRGGELLAELEVISDGALAIEGGDLRAVGPAAAILDAWDAPQRFDAQGAVLVPGFVDSHTHPVFAGTREDEFELRVKGATYVEIAQAGGGILSTVRGVRAASEEQLLAGLLLRLDRFLAAGTTTIEAKTGYGLSLEDELKCLRVLAQANASHAVDVVPTFLGAHDFPPEYRQQRSSYVELILEEMLPRVAESGLAEFCDIFTEEHAFGLEDSRRIMQRAAELGLGLRLHVDQLTPLGGAELAAELGATSADHLEFVSEAGIEALAESAVVPVLCPLVPLYLRVDQEAPARRMIRAGLAPALATDFNPGSCYLQSLPEVFTWAALRMGLSVEECLNAGTLNAACSLGRGDRIGSIEAGKAADFALLDLPNFKHLTYEFGRNPVSHVFKAGRCVYDRSVGSG